MLGLFSTVDNVLGVRAGVELILHREEHDSSHRERMVFISLMGRLPLYSSIVYMVKDWFSFHSWEGNP